MASTKSFAGEIEESFLTCAICYQPYNTPKAMPCLHTFCLGCLRDYYYSRYEGTDQFPCPVCRQVIYVPPNGLDGFPDNHFITSLSDTVHAKKLQPGEYQQQLSQLISESYPFVDNDQNNETGLYRSYGHAKLNKRFGNFGTEAPDLLHVSGLSFSPLTDDIVIADCSLNKITIYSIKGEYRSSFLCDCSIRDLSVTRTGTILASVSRHGSAIMCEYSFDGKLIASYGNFYKFDNPFGMAVSSRNKIYITCLQQNCIRVFTERKRASINFGSRGSGINHLSLPYFIAINTNDDIIVSDSGNHRIKVHKNDGTVKFQIGQQGVKEGELFYPMGVCADKYDNIYVADANNYRVQMFSPDGVFLACPVQRTFELGNNVKPTNVIFAHNKLFVALRGLKFAEIHSYDWDTSHYRRRKSTKSTISSFSWCCCCKKDYFKYEDL